VRLVNHIMQFYFTFKQEKVHPLQGGLFRRKIRRQRRSGMPLENPMVFYPRRLREIAATHWNLVAYYWFLHRMRKKVERDTSPYVDRALTAVETDGTPAPAFGVRAAAEAAD
jgi:hypothetical protein